VEALEQSPQTRVGSLEILTDAERRRIHDWNATSLEYPQERCLHELFEVQARCTPDSVAVEQEGRSLTYGQLNEAVDALARRLRARGVGADRLVGICAERSLEMVVGLLGILKAGGAYLPVDPDHPPELLEFVLRDAAPVLLLVQEKLRHRLPAGAAGSILLDGVAEPGQTGGSADPHPSALRLGADPGNLAYVIYTSGSTGRPKGAMNEHRAVVNRLHWMQHEYGLSAEDRVLQKTPFSFDVSVWEFFWPLLNGARLVLARAGGHKDPAYLGRLMESARVTRAHFVPSMLQAFLEHAATPTGTSLRHVFCSGEEL
jgi:non-ribosomal peptide synthetase component F